MKLYQRYRVATVVIVTFLGSLFSFLTYRHLLHKGPKDYQQWQDLLASSKAKQGSCKILSEQSRKGISKDLYFRENPLYFHIESKESKFYLSSQKERMEALEQFDGVSCIIQEKIFYVTAEGKEVDQPIPDSKPYQLIRYFVAEDASLNYASQKLIANKVKMWSFKVPGLDPWTSFDGIEPVLVAQATKLTVIINESHPVFLATDFKATFTGKEVHAAKASFDGDKILLEEEVVFSNEIATVWSNVARIDCEKETFTKADLAGNVNARFQDESYVCCDKAHIDLITFTTRASGKRQLYYSGKELELFGDEAILFFQKEPTIVLDEMQVIGNVQISHLGKQYTRASKGTYFPKNKELLLEGRENSPVLFFDVEKKTSISATIVRAFQLGEKGKEKIETKGVVHVVMKTDELDKLKERFKVPK